MKNIVSLAANVIPFTIMSAFALANCNVPASIIPNQGIVSVPKEEFGETIKLADDNLPDNKRGTCPQDMVLIDGDFCPKVEEICLYDVDIDGKRLPGPHKEYGACGEFKYPSRCLSEKRIHMHFCIDKYEFPNKEGQVPQDWMSFYDAQKAAKSLGKRMCTQDEWTLAAEGPEIHPLPYNEGYKRDRTACNFDNHMPNGLDVFKATTPNSPMSKILRSMLVPSGSKPRCVSPYGVYDMAGNVDEFTVNESGHPYISALKGGHIWHIRAASRPATLAHGPTFAWYETSTRSCVSN